MEYAPQQYLDDFFACSIYLLNTSPTRRVRDNIPENSCSGTKNSVENLIFFCSIAFSHVPDEIRRKLDKKSEGCIFTSYSE